ncbi:MAG: endonuclease III domain-containing protein [Dehalococcoidia bacterium]
MAATYAELDRMHAWRGWHWWPDGDPFEVCVGAILVQNTSWTNVERALERLRGARALDFPTMAKLGSEELEELVRPSGQYRQKAKKLRALIETAKREGGFDHLLALDAVTLRERLLATWGIGPETADCIVCYASGKPALVVDAYTARFFTRLGHGPGGSGYDAWQGWMLARLPTEREVYARLHALIVLHCKHLCRKRAPQCGACGFLETCSFGRAKGEGAGASDD